MMKMETCILLPVPQPGLDPPEPLTECVGHSAVPEGRELGCLATNRGLLLGC